MSSFVWQVRWFSDGGEECCEEFNKKSDAQNFMQYNDWQGNEHPKLSEVELASEYMEA